MQATVRKRSETLCGKAIVSVVVSVSARDLDLALKEEVGSSPVG